MIETFNDKKVEIYEVKSYAKQIAPKFENFDVEFDDDGTINRLQIIPVDTGKGSDLTGASWYKDMGSKKLDSLLVGLGITENKLNVLKEKLKAAHCISVKSGEPTEIGFQRSGLGEYSFVVFDKPMSDSLKKQYSDSCLYRYVNSKLILEYGGGAVGPQCFPKR
ncbi:hypothetical protein [Mucilaginibacter sp. dw_454]|uniref:hypothetical protein n=1 Tax=Mucilaginibacter sp. dw_454 TaxID=2720079 RepID=UPI001BD34725|nr:hypothetical protein [Mucilaginibacter sp. dw_454]